ncbi:hypothetical protein M378DRAFT_70444 [Amanita muscaria Koide BX008]|uniref:Alpha/beta hydrolase fold-3 domain-containing protein n=1 Tax=Amanita muscaria (strain Koide BX008) TaxID=946122 RepID=A0A0C2XH25_AMAMK|nr:hypothetical protein M378DRAFT_70444 [Amanita muscaria Koide BX008]
MPLNTLTTEVGLKLGPVLLETLVKHYFDRLKKSADPASTQLKQDELLYHEAFNVVKEFMRAASFHSVEELQAFSNTRTPSPPRTHIVRLRIPMSCCDKAAPYLIQALGGEEHARTVVGGVKWWQVRSMDGIEGQWITSKKDWREAQKRHKMQHSDQSSGSTPPMNEDGPPDESQRYEEAMDEMRCILYAHGGGYFFGSVDQERYSIERFARKINGRVFAIDYRLAPQYPFPCAIHDLLAAYLYLIDPPEGADHRPVNPGHIVIAGDSAGGGLALALLQVLRDSCLPMPAGGVLISPWCDLTHSFPSIHTNTETDVMPHWGLSLMKPSILWPPPNEEEYRRIHESLRSRIRLIFGHRTARRSTSTIHTTNTIRSRISEHPLPVDIGSTTPVPSLHHETITLITGSGEALTLKSQVHLYTQNSLLGHPLVSPALSYLGGLPPLLFIASNGEVLRDEIIYTAHKAANPSRYPVHPSAQELYPPLQGIQHKYSASRVHLQVYDDAAHVLPILFAFTTPAKFCFRAMATFCKHVTGMDMNSTPTVSRSMPNIPSTRRSESDQDQSKTSSAQSEPSRRSSLRRSLSERVQRAAYALRRKEEVRFSIGSVPEEEAAKERPEQRLPSDVGGPRFRAASSPLPRIEGERYAGDPAVYESPNEDRPWIGPMIRERVSTQGIIRPLEPESELIACNMPANIIGYLSERAIRRYLDNAMVFDKKFARRAKAIQKERLNNLRKAEQRTTRTFELYQDMVTKQNQDGPSKRITPSRLTPTTLHKSWVWALDGKEKPPPSSIVARRDTKEAQQLAEIADKALLPGEHALSGNHLWSLVVNFFTNTPERFTSTREKSS